MAVSRQMRTPQRAKIEMNRLTAVYTYELPTAMLDRTYSALLIAFARIFCCEHFGAAESHFFRSFVWFTESFTSRINKS